MKTQDISMPAFQYTDTKYAKPARGRAKIKVSALSDELIRPKQVLRFVPTFPPDC